MLSKVFQQRGQIANFDDFKVTHKKEILGLFANKSAEHKRKHVYIYDSEHFDSADEVAFFISEKLKNKQITRNKSFFFEYEVNAKKHKYFPDFIEGEKYIEIKGAHLFKNGYLANPFDKTGKFSSRDRAKMRCMIDNGVVIVTDTQTLIQQLKEKGIDVFSFRKDMSYETCAKVLWKEYKISHPGCDKVRILPESKYLLVQSGLSVEEYLHMKKQGNLFKRDQKINFKCCNCGLECSKTLKRISDFSHLTCKSCSLKEAFGEMSEKSKKAKIEKSKETFAKNHPNVTLGQFLAEKAIEKYGSREAFDAVCTEGRREAAFKKYGVRSCWAHVNAKRGENEEN